MEISQPLAELDWIPRPRLLALRRLGIETVDDLLNHFPRRHEDRHQFPEFPREESDTPICLCGEVTKTRILRFGGWKKIFEATLQEPNETLLPVELHHGDRSEAIRAIHFPKDWESLSAAREHLVLSEFFGMQMLIASRRVHSLVRIGAAHCGRGDLLEKFLGALPFE